MNKYVIDFLDEFGCWYSYDIWGNDSFDAACELISVQKGVTVLYVNRVG